MKIKIILVALALILSASASLTSRAQDAAPSVSSNTTQAVVGDANTGGEPAVGDDEAPFKVSQYWAKVKKPADGDIVVKVKVAADKKCKPAPKQGEKCWEINEYKKSGNKYKRTSTATSYVAATSEQAAAKSALGL